MMADRTGILVHDGKFRLYGAPSRQSGVECVRCSMPDMPFRFPTASLPGALRWMRAHELRAHGGHLADDPEATGPAMPATRNAGRWRQ